MQTKQLKVPYQQIALNVQEMAGVRVAARQATANTPTRPRRELNARIVFVSMLMGRVIALTYLWRQKPLALVLVADG